ncbi:MAG: hypothetical protein Q9168_006103 [Polycauliona sp. 1 TL-2023]
MFFWSALLSIYKMVNAQLATKHKTNVDSRDHPFKNIPHVSYQEHPMDRILREYPIDLIFCVIFGSLALLSLGFFVTPNDKAITDTKAASKRFWTAKRVLVPMILVVILVVSFCLAWMRIIDPDSPLAIYGTLGSMLNYIPGFCCLVSSKPFISRIGPIFGWADQTMGAKKEVIQSCEGPGNVDGE